MHYEIRHKVTGQKPTEQEMGEIKKRARYILDNPYSSPEQIQWAMDVLDPKEIITMWMTNRTKREGD